MKPHTRQAEREASMPTLFDLAALDQEQEAIA